MNGLYLVEPYGQKIADGEMTAIAKAKPLDLAGEHILVSGKLAYGTIELGEPEQVSVKEFESRQSEHCISRSDRLGWWTDTEELYLYKVISFDAYEYIDQNRHPAQRVFLFPLETPKYTGITNDGGHMWDFEILIKGGR